MTDGGGRVAVITGVERRRRWSVEEKQRLVAEAAQPGMSVSVVARRHGLHPTQLYNWRRQARAGVLGAGVAGLAPVRVVATPGPGAGAAGGMIEIALPNGWGVRVSDGFDAGALRRVLAVVGPGC